MPVWAGTRRTRLTIKKESTISFFILIDFGVFKVMKNYVPEDEGKKN